MVINVYLKKRKHFWKALYDVNVYIVVYIIYFVKRYRFVDDHDGNEGVITLTVKIIYFELM